MSDAQQITPTDERAGFVPAVRVADQVAILETAVKQLSAIGDFLEAHSVVINHYHPEPGSKPVVLEFRKKHYGHPWRVVTAISANEALRQAVEMAAKDELPSAKEGA